MARRDDDSGSLTNRLMSRADPGLRRRRVQGGGEVFSGPTASRALKALGARAMTMDNTIFVDEGFDPGSPEDLALLAHERHHQAESGGTDQHSEFDLEELAARAREQMVLHLARQGGDADEILQKAHEGPNSYDEVDRMVRGSGSGDPFLPDGTPDPMHAYRKMLEQGMTHEDIVETLADHVLQERARTDFFE